MAETESTVSASETVSQLLARILDQLALSAWLPAAALTLLTWFVMRVGTILDQPQHPAGPGETLSRTFESLGNTSIGGLLLLVAAVIVLTMLTQAFSFEAIRVMEGYWGTNRVTEFVARRRCNKHRRVRAKLDTQLHALTRRAWVSAEDRIGIIQQDLAARSRPIVLTANVVATMRARALGERPLVTLTPEEADRLNKTDWKNFADPELLRRRVSVQKRLRDYPTPAHVLPTRLGNVLRHHEDKTNRTQVENMVDDVYDTLPFTLRLSHDEHRSRLDLYCSMVFVLIAAGTIATLRFGTTHWGYTIGSILTSIVGAAFCYRAAVASARAYGAVLIVIANRVATTPTPAT